RDVAAPGGVPRAHGRGARGGRHHGTPARGRRMSVSPETEWLCRQIRKLTTSVSIMTPSEWTEKRRYLPPSSSSMPGYFRFDVVPYMREIIDCMSPESDVRHVTIMKGVQVGATTLL